MPRELTEEESKIADDLWQKVLEAREKVTLAYNEWWSYHEKINPIENMWIEIELDKESPNHE